MKKMNKYYTPKNWELEGIEIREKIIELIEKHPSDVLLTLKYLKENGVSHQLYHKYVNCEVQELFTQHNILYQEYRYQQKLEKKRNSVEVKEYMVEYRKNNREYYRAHQENTTKLVRIDRKKEIELTYGDLNLFTKVNDSFILNSDGILINTKYYTVNTPSIRKDGYAIISFNGKGVSHHRLVGEVFVPNPDNKPEINHKNGKRDDNRAENLEWVTRQENIKHSFNTLNRKSNLSGRSSKRIVLNTSTGVYYNSPMEASESLPNTSYQMMLHFLNGKYENKTDLIYV